MSLRDFSDQVDQILVIKRLNKLFSSMPLSNDCVYASVFHAMILEIT